MGTKVSMTIFPFAKKNVSIRIIMFLRNKSTKRKKIHFIVRDWTDILNALLVVEYSSIDKNDEKFHSCDDLS